MRGFSPPIIGRGTQLSSGVAVFTVRAMFFPVMNPRLKPVLIPLAALLVVSTAVEARMWTFSGIPDPVDAEFVALSNNMVVLQGANGKSCEVPLANFSPADQKYVIALASGGKIPLPEEPVAKPRASRSDFREKSVETLTGPSVSMEPGTDLHITGTGDPIAGCNIKFSAPDGWLFFDNIPASVVEKQFLDRFTVRGAKASLDKNLRITAYGQGSVVIPLHKDDPAALLFDGASLSGTSLKLEPFVKYSDGKLSSMKTSAKSLLVKRGHMVTLAEKEDGTGISVNYVAQDHDVVVNDLPAELQASLRFVRVFPWRWTSKKGIAGGITENLNLGWFYDWNIGQNSTPDLEYVAIKQKRYWPGLDQDWKRKGTVHLLGYNEPDKADQAKMTVDEAISGWPELLGTGLRLGSPAVSDGGLGWLYDFMKKADERKLRVDFVAVHYYRATADPGDARGAANQMRSFLEQIHERTKRPIWITEWNNGANWTSAPDPNEKQQKAAIEAMIKMLDETPFVERYALYNWVEDCRMVKDKKNALTPAGEAYRDKVSPLAFSQPRRAK